MEKRARAVRKTCILPPDLIARVRRLFRARTETQTILLALREMTFMEEVERALRSTSATLPAFKPLR